jgi:hypothetical protein
MKQVWVVQTRQYEETTPMHGRFGPWETAMVCSTKKKAEKIAQALPVAPWTGVSSTRVKPFVVLALLLCLLAVAGCGNCSDAVRFDGILLVTGNCKSECCSHGAHDPKTCNCSRECPCWRVR